MDTDITLPPDTSPETPKEGGTPPAEGGSPAGENASK